jgi:hypothetical protein
MVQAMQPQSAELPSQSSAQLQELQEQTPQAPMETLLLLKLPSLLQLQHQNLPQLPHYWCCCCRGCLAAMMASAVIESPGQGTS